MNIVADRYQFRARIIPEFLATLPICMLLLAHIRNIPTIGFLSLALFFIFFQGYFSSNLGRRLESNLKNNGKLEFAGKHLVKMNAVNTENDTIRLLIQAGEKSGLDQPFDVNTNRDAEKRIEAIIIWLIGQTRDTEVFPAVFDKLCDYGFYRNMLALRWFALGNMLIAFLLILMPVVILKFNQLDMEIELSLLLKGSNLYIEGIWFLLAGVWVLFWTKMISLDALTKANQNYITALLEAVPSVEVEKKTTSDELNL